MTSAYYDSTYLFKLQCEEAGTVEVRAHASTVRSLSSAVHARAEFVSACHRKIREGSGTHGHLEAMLAQFRQDCLGGAIVLLPLTDLVFARLEGFYLTAPATSRLRASGALHLACAAEHGFTEIYSNDRHLLAAAPLFGMKGINVIGSNAP